MADANTSLPVRTEAAGDVIVKVADATVPAQQLAVDASGRVTAKIAASNGDSLTATGTSLDVNVTNPVSTGTADGSTFTAGVSSEQPIGGVFDDTPIADIATGKSGGIRATAKRALHTNLRSAAGVEVGTSGAPLRTDPTGTTAQPITDNGGSLTVDGTIELGATTLAALESITVQNGAGGSAVNIQDGGNSITVDGTVELGATTLAALESITVQNGSGAGAVNIQDGGNSITVDGTVAVSGVTVDGAAVSKTNPMPIYLQDSPGTEVNDYNTAATLAAAGTSNHDYTVTALNTFRGAQVWASASGKLKVEVQVESGVATGSFSTRFVGFNSTANPNIEIPIKELLTVAAGVRVRVIRTNKDNQSQDVYSTISGHEQT